MIDYKLDGKENKTIDSGENIFALKVRVIRAKIMQSYKQTQFIYLSSKEGHIMSSNLFSFMQYFFFQIITT